MTEYDFDQLTPYDLELLARDLLQAHWGITIESFKAGKDGGIDLRYVLKPTKTIVQVKHPAKTGYAGLIRELKKEVPKVQRLNPSRYIVVTSVALSAANKDEIQSIIGEEFLATSDILGREYLNNLLGQYPEIEKRHYKLWLASKAVLDKALHNAAVTRSQFKVRRVYEQARKYVPSSAFPKAMEMLGREGVVVIAGPPGVGKTTLADLLLYHHLEMGYQCVYMEKDIKEGEDLFQEGVRQVFYFDDFMGATFLGEKGAGLAGANDRAILNFVSMVRATPDARLVLATREHILTQALSRSERLRNSELDSLRVRLDMPDYSFEQRARILYNHLYFSDLPQEYIDKLLEKDFYLQIVRHDKFNPRLIEWLANFQRLRGTPAAQYQSFVAQLLRDPSEIWRHAYEQEITDAARSLLLTIFSFEGKAGVALLRTAFSPLHRERATRYGFQTRPEDFRLALRELANAFIKPTGLHGIEFINPSVLDWLNNVVTVTPENAVDIMAGANRFDQIARIWSVVRKSARAIEVIRENETRFIPALGQLMVADRRVEIKGGGTAYFGSGFEKRLAVVTEMADRLRSRKLAELIVPLADRMQREWVTENIDIVGATEVLSALGDATIISPAEKENLIEAIKDELLSEVGERCRSDELRELILVIDTDNKSDPAVIAAIKGFEVYKAKYFSQELDELRSEDECDGLMEDLEFFRDQLGVSIDYMTEKLAERIDEIRERSDAYEDSMYEEWKERRYDSRDDERSVSEMFSSLRGDRD